MYVFMENSGGCLFHYDNPSGLSASIKGKAETFLGHEIREVPSPIKGNVVWWASVGDSTVVFGGKTLVSEMISIAEGKAPSLFQARTELQPILSAYATSTRVLLMFQRSEDAKMAAVAGGISYLIMSRPEGQLFRTITSSRGLAFSLTSSGQNGCEQQIGFQFSSYVASKLVSGIASILPWGPDQIQPESTEVDSANKLVRIHARYTQAQCARVGLGFERLPRRIASKTLDAYAGRYVFGKYEITVYRKQDKLFAESSYGKGELQPDAT